MKTSILNIRSLRVILSALALPLAALGQANFATPYTFITLAGKAPAGSEDGAGGEARFYYPAGVALDHQGNLYVADLCNHTIRKVTPAGKVTTLAGLAGFAGIADGTGSAARFYYPGGLAFDSAGDLYVADTLNHAIRKVTPAGQVTTWAGTAGSPGSSDGMRTAAQFSQPWDLVFDNQDNLYVADAANHTIRKITPAGEVTTLAGSATVPGSTDGLAGNARFHGPGGIALDAMGNLYVADTGNHTIRKVTPAGEVTTLAGLAGSPGSNDGFGTSARFYDPRGVTVDGAGNLYVGDTSNGTIRKITPAGNVTTIAGFAGDPGYKDGTGSAARFNAPLGVTVDGAGNIYVGDLVNCAIRKVTSAEVVTTVAGVMDVPGSKDGTGNAARFNYPWGAVLDSAGNLYVSSERNHTIRKMTPAGEVTTVAGLPTVYGSNDGTGSSARFWNPHGVGLDHAGNLYVADTSNHTIRRVTPAGEVTTWAGLAGNPGSTDGTGTNARFRWPWGIAVDSADNVYVADTHNHTIRRITPARQVTTVAGQPGSPGSSDGTGSAARFNAPWSLAVDSADNVYVADTGNFTIRRMTPAGEVTTLAGQAGNSATKDGTGAAAQFSFPTSVAIEDAGNVYVGDGFTIRKVTSEGVVTTLAGNATKADQLGNPQPGYADGTGSKAEFFFPSLAVDRGGNLYVADAANHTIRKGIPASSVPAPVLGPPSFSASQFGFDITGLPGLAVDLDSSSDLSQWQELGIYVLEGGTNQFVNPTPPPGAQFYRAKVH